MADTVTRLSDYTPQSAACTDLDICRRMLAAAIDNYRMAKRGGERRDYRTWFGLTPAEQLFYGHMIERIDREIWED